MPGDASKLAIKAAKAADLQIIATHLPPYPRNQHNRYFQSQLSGDGIFLIAWLGAMPVGHVFLALKPSTADAVLESQRQQPFIKDLYVHTKYRMQNIGSSLMEAAEEEARKHAAQAIGLGVSVKNEIAQNLYAKLGYENSGQGEYEEKGKFVDGDGLEKDWTVRCYFFVKPLAVLACIIGLASIG